MQEKLQKIKARCEELLAIAEKRTPGKWNDGNMREWFAVYTEPQDAAFISSCTENAEAEWIATIAVINSMGDYNSDIEMRGYYGPIVDAILLAWPNELLK